MSNLKSGLSSLCNEDEKKQLTSELNSSKILVRKLQEFCKKEIDAISKSSPVDYDSPSWAYKKADETGYIRAMTKLQNLLS